MKYMDNTFFDETSKKRFSKNNNYLTILSKKNLIKRFDSDYSSKPISETRTNKINFSLKTSKNKTLLKIKIK